MSTQIISSLDDSLVRATPVDIVSRHSPSLRIRLTTLSIDLAPIQATFSSYHQVIIPLDAEFPDHVEHVIHALRLHPFHGVYLASEAFGITMNPVKQEVLNLFLYELLAYTHAVAGLDAVYADLMPGAGWAGAVAGTALRLPTYLIEPHCFRSTKGQLDTLLEGVLECVHRDVTTLRACLCKEFD
ncbi:hypothetical protein [Noviherbaspirillum galbum]|uniref:Uncharacterized protein n=1 Tax=Noviherbaspirillum galbum TaxID=2709383 RepID=A0A6B3SHR4_9BURK|nr:hypothetical protein [Noviherbaspirillum galbum]NEX60200.1 hypothetical protein [Noviherbaspirillum galbum]